VCVFGLKGVPSCHQLVTHILLHSKKYWVVLTHLWVKCLNDILTQHLGLSIYDPNLG